MVSVDCGLNHSATTGEILDPGPGVIIPGGPPWGWSQRWSQGRKGRSKDRTSQKQRRLGHGDGCLYEFTHREETKIFKAGLARAKPQSPPNLQKV